MPIDLCREYFFHGCWFNGYGFTYCFMASRSVAFGHGMGGYGEHWRFVRCFWLSSMRVADLVVTGNRSDHR